MKHHQSYVLLSLCMSKKIVDAETSLTDVDVRVSEVKTSHAAVQVVNKLCTKPHILEKFLRIALEEKLEGSHPSTFMEKLLFLRKTAFVKKAIVKVRLHCDDKNNTHMVKVRARLQSCVKNRK